MTSNVTESESFEPTPAMQIWLDKSRELMTNNVSEISTACNISRQTWYRWWQDNNFRIWFNDNWESSVKHFGWYLDLIGLRKSESDYRYWAYMQEKLTHLNKLSANKSIKVDFIMDDMT